MKHFPILVAAVMIGGGAATPVPSIGAPQDTDFRWSGRIDAGDAVEIKGINGEVRAMAASGSQVEVTAVKRGGNRGDPADVTIEVVEHAGGVTICAVYPSEEGERPNECAPGDEGRMNVHDNDTKVDFTVRVPARVHLVATTVNGDVSADRIGGNVHATTVNGDIDVTAAGYVKASTVNGGIEASLGSGNWEGDLEFSTVNGSVELTLPEGIGATVSASTVNGSFDTDFPLTVQGRFGPKQVSGTIGSGGRQLHVSTVNGSISLRRGG